MLYQKNLVNKLPDDSTAVNDTRKFHSYKDKWQTPQGKNSARWSKHFIEGSSMEEIQGIRTYLQLVRGVLPAVLAEGVGSWRWGITATLQNQVEVDSSGWYTTVCLVGDSGELAWYRKVWTHSPSFEFWKGLIRKMQDGCWGVVWEMISSYRLMKGCKGIS